MIFRSVPQIGFIYRDRTTIIYNTNTCFLKSIYCAVVSLYSRFLSLFLVLCESSDLVLSCLCPLLLSFCPNDDMCVELRWVKASCLTPECPHSSSDSALIACFYFISVINQFVHVMMFHVSVFCNVTGEHLLSVVVMVRSS